jgi:hypothetical protein
MNIVIRNFFTFHFIDYLDVVQFGFNPEIILVTFGMTSYGPAVWCRAEHKSTRTKKCPERHDYSLLQRYVV